MKQVGPEAQHLCQLCLGCFLQKWFGRNSFQGKKKLPKGGKK